MNRNLMAWMVLVALLLVIGAYGLTLNARPANAQADNMQAYIQSLVDQGQAFTISSLSWGLDVDGSTIQVSELGSDFLCLSGEISIMMNPYKTVCTSFSTIAISIR